MMQPKKYQKIIQTILTQHVGNWFIDKPITLFVVGALAPLTNVLS